MQQIYATMKSIAAFVPSRCVENAEFERFLDTSNEWITKRTGIERRYFADKSETSSDLGLKAAQLALKRANISASEIDMVICATLSPDYLTMPSNACLISHKLGIGNKPAFDISAACSGFVYLLSLAKAFIESRAYRNILIIGAEKVSSVLDFSDRSTCVLFGDGAGAAVISATDDERKRVIDVNIFANGGYSEILRTPRSVSKSFDEVANAESGKARNPREMVDSTHIAESQNPSIESCRKFLQMRGNETFKLAVRTIANDVRAIMLKNHIASDKITYFIPHQANLRIINAVGEMIGMSREKIVVTIHKYGNTSAASIPMAINEIYENGRLKNGDLLLLDAFGGGITWGSALLYFNG